MPETKRRPKAISVVGYAALGFGLLLLTSSVGALGDRDFLLFGSVAGTVAVLIVAAAWALLRLRAWGAFVLEALSILFLLGLLGFVGVFSWATLQLSHPNELRMLAGAILLLLCYGVPLALAIRSLRHARLRGVVS